jgi:predicted nuclease with RNAse H fold
MPWLIFISYDVLKISSYISTATAEAEANLVAVRKLVGIDAEVTTSNDKHNVFLKKLGLPLLPYQMCAPIENNWETTHWM